MRKNKSKLDWCLRSENRMRKINPDKESAKEHIEKAKHNLRAADFNINGGFEDWGVSQLYYAMYRSLLAILFYEGYESKNHECTFNAIEYLIQNKKINLDLKDMALIRTTEQMTKKDAKTLREEFQYGTKTNVNKEILKEMGQKSREIAEKAEVIVNE
jgi:uncharacterized protein (UPF0332 family)